MKAADSSPEFEEREGAEAEEFGDFDFVEFSVFAYDKNECE